MKMRCRYFLGYVLDFTVWQLFLCSGKKSSSPEAKQNCCFFLGLNVHDRAAVDSSSPALWFGLLILITLSLAKAKPGQQVSVTHNPASSRPG